MEIYSLSDHLLSLDDQDNFSKMLTEEMPGLKFQEDFLLAYFQDSIIGHLVKGVVHNMNGLIQILSMQIELCKMDIGKDLEAIDSRDLNELDDNLKKRKERLLQMERVLAQIENMVNIIGYRGQSKEKGQKLLALDRVLKEELAFWNADLFFKHCVKKETNLSVSSSLTLVNENQLRDLIDSLLSACIEQMRGDKEGNLKVSLSQKDEPNVWHLEFEHTGRAFPVDIDLLKVKDCVQEDPHNPFLALTFKLARVRAKQIGATLKVEPEKISCLIPNTYTGQASI